MFSIHTFLKWWQQSMHLRIGLVMFLLVLLVALLAPVLGVRFDDLLDRKRRARNRRLPSSVISGGRTWW